jgi:hypothetical protein
MSWFKRTVEPSKPPEVIEPQRIDFIGEQAGPVEDDLKIRIRGVFTATPTVQRAYLARLAYGEPSGFSVGLCIRSAGGIDQQLQKQLAQVFAEVPCANEHLDILFLRGDQEAG